MGVSRRISDAGSSHRSFGRWGNRFGKLSSVIYLVSEGMKSVQKSLVYRFKGLLGKLDTDIFSNKQKNHIDMTNGKVLEGVTEKLSYVGKYEDYQTKKSRQNG